MNHRSRFFFSELLARCLERLWLVRRIRSVTRMRQDSSSEESGIRKAVNERGLTPGPVGLANTIAEDEAAIGTAIAMMEFESMGKGRKWGGAPVRRGVTEETQTATERRQAGG
jgi:hypothetical protein